MPITSAITVNQILTRVAVESGLDMTADPFGSTDSHYVQLSALLQTACEDLCLAHLWEFTLRKFEITTISGINEYELPDDFSAFVDNTGWNLDEDEPIYLITPQQWNAIKAGEIDPVDYAFRIAGGKLHIAKRVMPGGVRLSFEYISRNFVKLANPPNMLADSFISGSDLILFDRTLITRYLKALWFEAKGFDSGAAQAAFAQIFGVLTGRDKGGAILDVGGRSLGARLIDVRNIPEQGFGI